MLSDDRTLFFSTPRSCSFQDAVLFELINAETCTPRRDKSRNTTNEVVSSALPGSSNPHQVEEDVQRQGRRDGAHKQLQPGPVAVRGPGVAGLVAVER